MTSRFYKMGNFEEICNTGLSLGLGMRSAGINDRLQSHHHRQRKSSSPPFDHLFPSLSLGLSSPQHTNQQTPLKPDAPAQPPCDSTMLHRQTSSLSAVSSYYSNSSVKKEMRDQASGEEVEVEVEEEKVMSSSKASTDDQEEEGSARKKLRLSKQQSFLLEESFKDHATLNPKQKQALAKQLNLRPRQVEVWFQNRRARTKLKQTEVDCELLKKCCEALAEENRRLQKEVQELKALKVTAATPLYMQLPAATLTVCPSCERVAAAGATENSSKTTFPIGTKQQHFYNPLTHPSAAC